MAQTTLPPHDVADLSLAPAGAARIAWADQQMPVLRRVRERFARERPLDGVRIAACLHVTARDGEPGPRPEGGRRKAGAVLGQPALDPG